MQAGTVAPMRRLLPAALVALTALMVLAACSDDKPERQAAPTSSSTTASTTPATSTTASPACPKAGPQGPPPGDSGNEPGGDFDGDSRADRVWPFRANDRPMLRVLTASGGGSDVELPGMGGRVYGSADANGDGRDELFIGPSPDAGTTQVFLVHLVDCKAAVVRNPQGEAYRFEVGMGAAAGTEHRYGIGCVAVGGRRELVGLQGTGRADGTGDVQWKRTVVRLGGGKAENGEVAQGVYHRPQDQRAIELLRMITCGERVIEG